MTIAILSNEHRQALIAYMADHATDETLLNAVEETIRTREHLLASYKELSRHVKPPQATVPKPVVEPRPPEGIEPPGMPAKRIGAQNKDSIMRCLKGEKQTLAAINAYINGKTGNTQALLKLLWLRKELKFDGHNYFL